MVNYRYDLNEIEANHEAYANQGKVAASRAVRSLLRSGDRSRRAHRVVEPAHATARPAAVTAPKPVQPKLPAPVKRDDPVR